MGMVCLDSTPGTGRKRLLDGKRVLILCLGWFLGMQSAVSADEEKQRPLSLIDTIKRMSPELASKAIPVRIRGVVLPKEDGEIAFFIQDKSNGVFVQAPENLTKVKTAQEVEIEGVTDPGTFMPMINAQKITILGEGKLPTPLDVTGEMVVNRNLDARLVQIKGIVVAIVASPNPAEGEVRRVMIYAVIPGGSCILDARSPNVRDDPAKLLGTRFRALGPLSPIHDGKREPVGGRMYVYRDQDFEVLDRNAEDLVKLPLVPISQLGPVETDYTKPVVKRIRGIVTAITSPHSFFLQDDASGVHVRSFVQPIERVGKDLELIGVMQKIGDTEVFVAGFITDRGETSLPTPVTITEASLAELQKRHMRGRLEATVLHSRVHQKTGLGRVRAVKKGDKFEAVVDPIPESGPPLKEKTFEMALKFGSSVIYAHVPESIMDERAFEVGSNVRITGTLDSFIIPESGYEGTTLYPVQAKDLEYLAGPPTSPTEYLLMSLALATGLAAVVIGWNLTLRHRVRSRTAELAQEKERLRESEARYRRLADNSFDVIWTMDQEGNYTYISPSVKRMRGYTPEEFVELPKEKVYSPDSLAVFHKAMEDGRKKIQAGLPAFFHGEISGYHRDGSLIWTDVKATTVRDEDGKFLEILGVTREITQRKLAEEELQKSELRYRSLTEASAQAVWRGDSQGNPLPDMPTWLAYTGMTWEELKEKGWFDAVHPDDRVFVQAAVEKTMKEGRFVETEYRLRRHDGEYRTMEVRGVPMKDAKGNIVEWIGTCTDITDRRRAQELVQTSLREKEILLKEIHHRVKNNLQTITALLDLQAEKVANREAWEALRESRGRVRSMSLIHERLYRTQDQGRVNFKEYLESLITYLNQSYRRPGVAVAIHLDIDAPLLSLDQAVPCGLLVNELLMNSFKHAFPDRKEGKIQVVMRLSQPTHVCLTVRDDGIGLPANLDLKAVNSFGLTMVHNLAEQLRGQLELKNDSGCLFKLCFPLVDPLVTPQRKPS